MASSKSSYQTLKSFLVEKMRMSYIYQPVIIKKLLQSGGEADVRDLARMCLEYDESQIEYYSFIIKRYPK